MHAETNFGRTVDEAVRSSANLQSYIVSSAWAHQWLLAIARRLPRWSEPLFPGILASVLGLAGLASALRDPRQRENVLLYGSLLVLAFWASFGPAAGLYRMLALLPVFTFLRAPSRFGLIVVLALTPFAALTIRGWLD